MISDADCALLCAAAEAAGLSWRLYPGGAMLLEPWQAVRAHPELVEHLRQHKTDLGRYLARAFRPDLLRRDWLKAYEETPP